VTDVFAERLAVFFQNATARRAINYLVLSPVEFGHGAAPERTTGLLWASAARRLRRSAASSQHATASLARAKLTMSLRVPSGQRTRDMPGQSASGMTLGRSCLLLKMSVLSFCGFWKIATVQLKVAIRGLEMLSKSGLSRGNCAKNSHFTNSSNH